MLGGYVLNAATARSHTIIAPSRSELDLDIPGKIATFVKDIKPEIVLHLAAQTDVDLCEREPAKAAIANVLATKEIAIATAAIGGWLGYVSTGNVFGAEGKSIYNEIDLPNPVNYYGRSKLWGEHVITQHIPGNNLVVRAGWMIGGGPNKDHKFVGKIITQIRNKATELKAVDDRFGTITVAKDLANFLVSSAETRSTGLFHFASIGTVTRFEIAYEIAKQLRYAGAVTGVKSSLFPLSAPRPQSEGIASVFLSKERGIVCPGFWRNDLIQYISEF